MEDWLTFRDLETDTITSWERETSSAISLVSERDIKIKLLLPTGGDARVAWENNVNLLGYIEFNGEYEGRFELPLPFDGVFLARSSDGMHPNRLVWDNCLVEKPGVRLIRKKGETNNAAEKDKDEGKDKDENLLFRIGLVNGDHLDIPFSMKRFKARKSDKSETQEERAEFRKYAQKFRQFIVQSWFDITEKILPGYFPEWLLPMLGEARGKAQDGNSEEALEQLLCGAQEHKNDLKIFDRDDLAHRIVMTFPKWLQCRLFDRFFRWKGVLEDNTTYDILYALVPLVGKGIPSGIDGSGREFVYAPVENAIDFVSRIYSVKRFPVKRKKAQFYSEERRQNHVSFEGCLCPIESPESELVGISLQLARGARIDSGGNIVKAVPDSPAGMGSALGTERHEGFQPFLGWGASMIPFLHHNDDARNMMGAKNLRQALPVKGREMPVVKTGGERALLERVQRLIDIGVCPGCAENGNAGGLALGCDLLVAYMPWYGWNVDDAIVVSEAVCDRMAVVKKKEFSRFVKPGWKVETNPQCYGGHDVFEIGRELRKGDAIVILRGPGGAEQKIIYGDDATASVTVSFPRDELQDGIQGCLKYTLERTMPLGVGDKLMGRHGNKGVVSKILPRDEMPRLPDGRPVEILLNPHGVLSRMNPGQLLETHIGWLLKEGRCKAEDICLSDRAIGYPEKGIVRHDKVRDLLEDDKLGMNRNGAVTLSWSVNGDCVHSIEPIVVGFQYFVRLNHIPELKAQARQGGWDAKYSPVSGQAAHGRSIGGGQRVGEMEMWGLRAHMAYAVIDEMIGEKSDVMEVRERHQGLNLLERYMPKEVRILEMFEHGFGRYLRTWLRALLLDVKLQDGDLVFNRIPCDSTDAIQAYMNGIGCKVGRVSSAKGQLVKKGSLICPTCKDSLGNNHEFNWRPRTAHAKFKVRDLLREFGLECGSLEMTGNGDSQIAVSTVDGQPAGMLRVKEEESRGNKGLCLRIDTRGVSQTELAAAVPAFFCFDYEKEWREDLSRQLSDGRLRAEDFNVVCSKHRKKGGNFEVVGCPDAKKEEWVEGLQSEDVFGREVFCGTSNEKWGCIELPFQIEGKELLGRVLEKFGYKDGVESMPEFKIGAIPVLPRRFRLPQIGDGYGGTGCPNELDAKGYAPVLDACAEYRKKDNRKDDGKELTDKVFDLFCLLLKRLVGKEGLLRHEGLGRRVDHSFRLVITPDPTLKIDECGVPEDILREVLQLPGEKHAGRTEKLARYIGWSWKAGAKGTPSKVTGLKEYLRMHPDVRIILNRQPSLHRDSVLSFRPVPIGRNEDGTWPAVLRLPPLCCKCFAADFDGDEMVGHAVLSEDAAVELDRMTLKDNQLSIDCYDSARPDACDITYNLDRDFVSGLELLQREGKLEDVSRFGGWSEKAEMKESLNVICRSPDSGDASKKLSELACRAFDAVTTSGCSFGFYDLFDCRNVVKDETQVNQSMTNEDLDNIAKKAVSKYGGPLKLLVETGANGNKQIRQFIVGRGKLPPCDRQFPDSTLHDCTLVDGMTWRDVFESSWNARSSMCDKKLGTARSGGLTRALVFALQHVRITEEACSCNDLERSPLHCKCKNGICAKCYGKLPDGKLAKSGSPIGLIAALAIGERGTQVSMKSAHSGGGDNDFDSVRKLIYTGKRPKDCGTKAVDNAEVPRNEGWFNNFNDFYNTIMARAKDYQDVARRHFEVLWRQMLDVEGVCRGIGYKCDSEVSADDLVRNGSSQMRLLAKVWSGQDVLIPIGSMESAFVMFGWRK